MITSLAPHAALMNAHHHQAPWQLVIWRKFKSLDDRDRFLGVWKDLAKHVKAKEAGALAYEISIADNDPMKILVFERYTSKDYYRSVHQTSGVRLHQPRTPVVYVAAMIPPFNSLSMSSQQCMMSSMPHEAPSPMLLRCCCCPNAPLRSPSTPSRRP